MPHPTIQITRGQSFSRLLLGAAAIGALGSLSLGARPALALEPASTFESIVPMPASPVLGVGSIPGALSANDAVPVDWKMLGGLDYMSGKMPATLQSLNGKLVKVPGFIVPLDDYDEEGAEFLLVPYFGACVHVPPPPPNQMVFVRMQGGKKIKFGWWDPVWMEGTLKIEHFESPYGAAGFQITGTRVTPYKAD